MATARPIQLQDHYLNALRKEKVPLTVYLMNGVPLKGRIIAFDSFVVLLEIDGKQQMVFKHAISTIQSSKNIDLRAEGESDRATGPVPA